MARKRSLADDLASRPGKYFLARKAGHNKKKAAIVAGYANGQHTSDIERTDTYQHVAKAYKDVLLDKISLEQIADAHVDNITQDKDRGARNKAIEMAKEWIEPSDNDTPDVEHVVVVLQ